MLNLFDKIQSDIQSKSKKLISIEDVRKFVDNELKVIGLNNYTYRPIVNEFGNKLMNLINGKIPYLMQCNVIVVGGGADKLQDVIKESVSHALFNTDIASLCKSNFRIAEAKWKKD